MTPDDAISRAAHGDIAAFTRLVSGYQDMAFGYALTILRDFHLAQDATQEAFVAAYFGLGALADPAKFPSWLRGIVRHHCFRLLRRRQLATVALDAAQAVAAREPPPDQQVAERDGAAQVLAAIDALPEALRAVTVLFYLEEYSQRQIAAFLALPVTTVNNRLHAARKRLREGSLTMTSDPFARHGLPGDFAARVGAIVRARGPLVEARFAPDALPPVLNALTITDRARGTALTASVVQHLPDGLVRGIVLASPVGAATSLPAGTAVTDTDRPIDAGADPAAVGAAVAALKPPLERTALLETGIKVLDLLCPLPRSGTIGLFGDMGVGKAVLVAELQHNLREPGSHLTLVTFIQPGAEVSFMQPYPPAPSSGLDTLYVPIDQPEALASPTLTAAFDAIVHMTRELAALGLYPAIEATRSRSRLLDPALVGEEHYRVALEARALLAQYPESEGGEDQMLAARARKLRRFLSQACFVAEPFTHVPGEFVRREDTVRACAAILRGDYDALPEAVFVRIGPIEQAAEKAGTPGA